jgi:hypothetical protein
VHTRRVSSFLLGAWLAGSILVGFIAIQSVRLSNMVLNAPIEPAGQLIEKLGYENAGLLLRHAAAEQTRFLEYRWEEAELLLGLALLACLSLATQRRVLPLVLCGIMLVLVLFQHFGVTNEMAYRGRITDFPPGNTAIGPVTRMLLLQQVYFGVEVMKLVAGGVLASFLFMFRTSRRSRKSVRAIGEVDEAHADE